MAESAKQYDININLEGLPEKPKEDEGEGRNPLSGAAQVFAQMPYGGDFAKGIGSIGNSAEKAINFVTGEMSYIGMAVLAVSLARKAHDIASKYAKDLRQSGELQKRAGIYRRDNR